MASPYKTGNRAEALVASPEIVELASRVLTSEELSRAMQISQMLVSSKSKKTWARQQLQSLVSPPPKRPIYYAQHELGFLPTWTRNAIRYLGDYIDLLTKHLALMLTQSTRVGSLPLGACIQVIERSGAEVPTQLIDWLKQYNSFLYKPGKHDFRLPVGRRAHRFTSLETVLTAFVTMSLAQRLRVLTRCAPELNCSHLTSEK